MFFCAASLLCNLNLLLHPEAPNNLIRPNVCVCRVRACTLTQEQDLVIEPHKFIAVLSAETIQFFQFLLSLNLIRFTPVSFFNWI